MKKLMMAAAIVCAAVGVQAASVTWTTAATLIEGNPNDFDAAGNVFAEDGWKVYLFDNASLARSSIISGTEIDTAKLSSALTTTEMSTGDYGGSFNVANVTMTKDSGLVNGYIVILNDTDLDGATKAYVSDVFSATVSSTEAAELAITNYGSDHDYNGALNATGTANWYDIPTEETPEPTSGLLLLLGMAGLALRRKQA